MADAVDILKQSGVENATAIVAASNTSGLPLGVAVGMIMKESGGANIYGHDAGGAMYGAGEVTEQNFKSGFLPVVLNGGTSNGVGPAQITYPGYFQQNPDYAWWDPYWSCLFGFNLIKQYCGGNYSFESLARAGSTYNSGNPSGTYNTYGKTFANLAINWTEKLQNASTDVRYDSQEDDVPSAQEIANAILDTQIDYQGGIYPGAKTSLRNEVGWTAFNFSDIPSRVWGHSVKRAGLPDNDPRAGKAVQTGSVMAWMDAFILDVKKTVVDSLSGVASDETVIKAVEEAINKCMQHKETEPGTVPATDISSDYVIIQAGDTLKAVAEAHQQTVQGIVDLNPGLDPNAIYVGQKVRIK